MKGLLLKKYMELEVTDLPKPEIGPNDVLVRVKACGICGSDVEQYKGAMGSRGLPMIPGHEPLGIIEERLGTKERSGTHVQKDIHEASLKHLRKALKVSLELCRLFPNDFTRIDCLQNSELLSVQAVNDLLWKKITPLLPTIILV